MAMKDVIDRVHAKRLEQRQQRDAERAAAKAEQSRSRRQGDGDVFSNEEIDAMERAIDRAAK